jgi:dTDP-4-amino-4,6-dideoxygalactose transaminase
MTIKSVGATPIVVELGSATFEGNPDQVKQAIEKLGYSASFIS